MRRGRADAVRRSKRRGQFETEGSSRVHVMDYGGYPYEEPYARKRRRVNYFAWTVAIVLLSGFALAAWLGSFYIFDQPERQIVTGSYKDCTKLIRRSVSS